MMSKVTPLWIRRAGALESKAANSLESNAWLHILIRYRYAAPVHAKKRVCARGSSDWEAVDQIPFAIID
jgi:hypothetical protein